MVQTGTDELLGLSPLAQKYLALLDADPETGPDATARLAQLRQVGTLLTLTRTPCGDCTDHSLRQLLLLENLPGGHEGQLLRPRIWRLLLRLHVLTADEAATGTLHPLLDANAYQELM